MGLTVFQVSVEEQLVDPAGMVQEVGKAESVPVICEHDTVREQSAVMGEVVCVNCDVPDTGEPPQDVLTAAV